MRTTTLILGILFAASVYAKPMTAPATKGAATDAAKEHTEKTAANAKGAKAKADKMHSQSEHHDGDKKAEAAHDDHHEGETH